MDYIQPTRLLCPWDSPGKNTGVGCYTPFQGNLPSPRTEPASLMSSVLADGFFTTGTTWESQNLLLSTKTILRVEHFQNGLAQFAIDKPLIETSAFKCAFQVLESSAQKKSSWSIRPIKPRYCSF